jgi:hypothetical protein
LRLVLVELAAGLLSCGAAQGAEMASLQALMSCVEEPTPTTVLLDLSTAGILGVRSGPGDDDDYCWPLTSPLEWDGATFGGLCVVTDDPEAMSAHPEFFWSASLAPWTEVWLTSTIAPAALDRWARENLPSASRYEIDPLDGVEGTGALSCSEWHFPLPG